MYDTEWDSDNHHPVCPGGCGNLADECACRRPRRDRDERASEARS